MLNLAVRIRDDAAALRMALPALAGVARPDRRLFLIDQGSRDASREMIQGFLRHNAGTLVPLDTPLTVDEAAALARDQSGADYVLVLDCTDRVNHAGLERLEQSLIARKPDLAVLASGWWMTGPDHPLPGPDAVRAAALSDRPNGQDLAGLHPDPRRLLIRGGQCDAPDPLGDPRAAWDVWADVTGAAKQTLFHPDPVLLRPLPHHGAAAVIDALAGLVGQAPKSERAAHLAHALPRLDDALALSPPGASGSTMEAGTRLLSALPRPQRRALCAAPGPTGAFFAPLQARDTGGALAVLAMLANARAEMQMRALADEYTALRADLTAALPGPDYLRELHARLRGM